MDTVLAPSPHFRSKMTIASAMYGVILALLPGIAVGVYYFGPSALRVLFMSVLGCLIFEGVVLKLRGRDLSPLKDGSALCTGLLLAMNVPSIIPSWMAVHLHRPSRQIRVSHSHRPNEAIPILLAWQDYRGPRSSRDKL